RYVGVPYGSGVPARGHRVAEALAGFTAYYGPLPPIASPERGLATAARLHAQWPDNAALVARGSVGAPETALAGADVVVHETIRHARLAAAPSGPPGVPAYADPGSRPLVVRRAPATP